LIYIKVYPPISLYHNSYREHSEGTGERVSESQWLPQINNQVCTGCGECILRCPTGALGLVHEKAVVLHPDVCTYSAICEEVCPVDAIELPYMVRLEQKTNRSHREAES